MKAEYTDVGWMSMYYPVKKNQAVFYINKH